MLNRGLQKDLAALSGPADRAFACSARLAKTAVLLLAVMGLAWIGVTSDTPGRYAAGGQYAQNR